MCLVSGMFQVTNQLHTWLKIRFHFYKKLLSMLMIKTHKNFKTKEVRFIPRIDIEPLHSGKAVRIESWDELEKIDWRKYLFDEISTKRLIFFLFFYGPWLIFKPVEIRDENFQRKIKNESFINKICQLKNIEMNRERYFLR